MTSQLRRVRSASYSTVEEFVQGIADVAGQLRMTVLRRPMSARELDAALQGGSLPIVLVRELPDGTHEALVIRSVSNGKVAGVVIGRDLDERSVVLERATVTQQWHKEGRSLLIPVAVTTSGAGAWESLDPDASPLARLARLLGQERKLVLNIYLYAALAGLFGLTLPLGVQAIIGLVSGGLILQPVVLLIAFVIVGTMANGALQLLQLSVVESVQQRVFARLAFELTGRLQQVRLDRVTNVDLPELMNRFFEIKTIQKSLGKLLTDWVTAGLQVLFGLILLTFYHPYFSLFGMALIVTLGFIFYVTAPKGWKTSLGESKYKYRVAHWLEEIARTTRSFKFAGKATLPVDRMDHYVGGYLDNRQAHFRVLITQSVAFVVFKTVITAGLLILGSTLVVNRQITLGQFVASEIVIVTVLLAVEKLILGLADVYDILTALEKAGHAANIPGESLQGVAPLKTDGRGTRLELRGVSFTYEHSAHPALSGVTLVAESGSRLGITGPPGSGESTLLSLIAGLFPGYEGSITHDGISLRDLDLARARASVAYLGQDLPLFDGTVEENIALGRPGVRTESVLEVAARVGLDRWLQDQPDGLQSAIEAAGRSVPLSVAKRILLARALVDEPRLLLMDSFLDDEIDPADKIMLSDLVFAPQAPWTLVVVTHDPSLLSRCDHVLVLRRGEVSASDTWSAVESQDPYIQKLLSIR